MVLSSAALLLTLAPQLDRPQAPACVYDLSEEPVLPSRACRSLSLPLPLPPRRAGMHPAPSSMPKGLGRSCREDIPSPASSTSSPLNFCRFSSPLPTLAPQLPVHPSRRIFRSHSTHQPCPAPRGSEPRHHSALTLAAFAGLSPAATRILVSLPRRSRRSFLGIPSPDLSPLLPLAAHVLPHTGNPTDPAGCPLGSPPAKKNSTPYIYIGTLDSLASTDLYTSSCCDLQTTAHTFPEPARCGHPSYAWELPQHRRPAPAPAAAITHHLPDPTEPADAGYHLQSPKPSRSRSLILQRSLDRAASVGRISIDGSGSFMQLPEAARINKIPQMLRNLLQDLDYTTTNPVRLVGL